MFGLIISVFIFTQREEICVMSDSKSSDDVEMISIRGSKNTEEEEEEKGDDIESGSKHEQQPINFGSLMVV